MPAGQQRIELAASALHPGNCDQNGAELCEVEHVGMVLSGRAAVKMADGTELVIQAGDVFAIPPGHDSWVLGQEPYVSVHVLGASGYAAGHDGAA